MVIVFKLGKFIDLHLESVLNSRKGLCEMRDPLFHDRPELRIPVQTLQAPTVTDLMK